MRKPIVLVVDDEPTNRLFASRVLASVGWDVVEAENGDAGIGRAREILPDLVLMDIDMPLLDGWQATAAIRAAEGAVSKIPILAYTIARIDDEELRHRGFDGRMPKPVDPNAMADVASAWRPKKESANAERLRTVFGDEIDGLVARFRDQLEEAVASLEAGGEVPAHRIAGVAGTLGFVSVSESWLRLSEQGMDARDDAYREARLALADMHEGIRRP